MIHPVDHLVVHNQQDHQQDQLFIHQSPLILYITKLIVHSHYKTHLIVHDQEPLSCSLAIKNRCIFTKKNSNFSLFDHDFIHEPYCRNIMVVIMIKQDSLQ